MSKEFIILVLIVGAVMIFVGFVGNRIVDKLFGKNEKRENQKRMQQGPSQQESLADRFKQNK